MPVLIMAHRSDITRVLICEIWNTEAFQRLLIVVCACVNVLFSQATFGRRYKMIQGTSSNTMHVHHLVVFILPSVCRRIHDMDCVLINV